MLRYSTVRLIVNEDQIIELPRNKPMLVRVQENHPSVVLTDGFHFTAPKSFNFEGPGYFNLDVSNRLSDENLIKGAVVAAFMYTMSLASGMLGFFILSIIPFLRGIWIFYFDKKKFLRLIPVTRYRRSMQK